MRLRMKNGTTVDTERASSRWEEARDWSGLYSDYISRNTRSYYYHQTLYRSRKGRYYLVRWNDRPGSRPRAQWISAVEAARWLLLNDHELPADLQPIRSVVEVE